MDDAIMALRKAVELEPAHAEAWKSLGACYEKAGRKKDAAAALGKARKLKPELFKKEG